MEYPICFATLPEDLEREIFEMAARSQLRDAFTLLTVSRHIYTWIKPILYETIVYRDPAIFPLTWFQKHGAYIQNLLLNEKMEASDVVAHLRLCPNVSNLAVWTGVDGISEGMLAHMRAMPLKQLSIDFHPLLLPQTDPQLAGPPGVGTGRGGLFADQLFAGITHLDLADQCLKWETWCGLAQLPKLTHLSLPWDSESEVIEGALEDCKLLQVLILISETQVGPAFIDDEPWFGPRVVSLGCTVVGDWVAGARGHRNVWDIAEERVKIRLELGGGQPIEL